MRIYCCPELSECTKYSKLRLFGTNEIEIRKPHPHVVISCIPQCSSVAGDRLSLELKFKPLVCTANENLKNRFIPLNISKTLHCQTQQHSGPLCEGKQRCFNRANSVAENSSYQKKKKQAADNSISLPISLLEMYLSNHWK